MVSASLALVLAAAAAFAPVPDSTKGSRTPLTRSTTLVTNVHVIAMRNDVVMRDAAVLIRDGRIAAVGARSSIRVPRDARVIDGRGGYLIPGLSDLHTHLWADQYVPDSVGRSEVGVMLANGLTTVRLMIGNKSQLALRRDIEAGRVIGPNLWLASPQLTGRPDTNSRVVTTPDEGRAAVREEGSAGYDFIKITNWIAPNVYDAIMDEANRRGLRVDGHVNTGVSVQHAAELGQHLQHLDGWFEALLPDSVIDRRSLTQYGVYDLTRWPTIDIIDERRIAPLAGVVARSGVWVTPTLALFNDVFTRHESHEEAMARPDWGLVPASFRSFVERAMERYWAPTAAAARTEERRARYARVRREVVKALADSGAHLVAGSDAPDFIWAEGYSLHRELAALAGAGLSAYQVLAMATTNAAEFLGATSEWGTIEAGKRADLVLLDANPLDDIRNTSRIRATIVGGRVLERAALDAMIDRAKRELNPGQR